MDPCRQDKNNAEGAGPANQNAGPDDATIVGPHELIRMPRRDAAGRREPNPPRDARADGAPPLVDMTCERLYRQYGDAALALRVAPAVPPVEMDYRRGRGRGLDRRRDHSRLGGRSGEAGRRRDQPARPGRRRWRVAAQGRHARILRGQKARRQGRRRRQRRAASRRHRAARSAARRRRGQDLHQADAIRLAARKARRAERAGERRQALGNHRTARPASSPDRHDLHGDDRLDPKAHARRRAAAPVSHDRRRLAAQGDTGQGNTGPPRGDAAPARQLGSARRPRRNGAGRGSAGPARGRRPAASCPARDASNPSNGMAATGS